MCSREIFTKKCRQQQIFDSDHKGAWHYNHVTFTPIAKKFMLYCRLIYMLSILCVRLTIKVKVGIPESFKVRWYSPQKTGSSHLKPVVLVPCSTECSGSKIKVDNRPSFPLFYTTKGTYVAALFHGQCAKCKTTWYPSYKITSNDRRIFTDLAATDDEGYLQITCQTVLEKKLLNDIATTLWVSGTTFNSKAKVYNVNF